MPLVLRSQKNSALTYEEMDGNFTYLSSSIFSINVNSFATTGSNTFNGDQTINGNQIITGSLTQGTSITIIGSSSHAEGYSTTTIGSYSHAEGNGNIAGTQVYYSPYVATGKIYFTLYGDVTGYFPDDSYLILDDSNYPTSVYGIVKLQVSRSYLDPGNISDTIVELYNTSINTNEALVGSFSTAILNNSTDALGLYSHAEGYFNKTVGYYSHAEGYYTTALGDSSHTEGHLTQTNGFASHAEGYLTEALGIYSHAEGRDTIALGSGSHAEGQGTVASGSYQHVTGKYNTQGDYTSLFIVGNGTSNNRSDAFKVTPNGSTILPVTSSGTPNWTGVNGEMIFGDDGLGNYVIWAYLGGSWKSGSLI